MSDVRRKYGTEFKKNAVKSSYASSKTVAEVARELGISDGILYRWRLKNTPDGDQTRFATLEEKNKALRLKTAEQAIEIVMLKKQAPTLRALFGGEVDEILWGINERIFHMA